MGQPHTSLIDYRSSARIPSNKIDDILQLVKKFTKYFNNENNFFSIENNFQIIGGLRDFSLYEQAVDNFRRQPFYLSSSIRRIWLSVSCSSADAVRIAPQKTEPPSSIRLIRPVVTSGNGLLDRFGIQRLDRKPAPNGIPIFNDRRQIALILGQRRKDSIRKGQP